jgi:hypothetical protein
VLFSIAGVVVLALPAVLEVLPRRYLAAWPRLVSGSGPWAEAQGG